MHDRLHSKDKRKGFEDAIRKDRKNVIVWQKYAAWEESQKEVERYACVRVCAVSLQPMVSSDLSGPEALALWCAWRRATQGTLGL